ncbi:MAG TPA: hypothetical protein VEB21_17480, partial [Terriglobales bacterium]|nr:hypothetical protein [Terriglobales bacterium]
MCWLRAAAIGWLLLVLAGALAAQTAPTVHLVSASDPVLATMVMTAKALHEPVLLFEAEDHEAVRHAASEWTGPRRCLSRPSTPRNAVALMESIAGQVCTQVEDLAGLARQLWPAPQQVIAFPQEDYATMLRAATLAGAIGAALLPVADPGAQGGPGSDGWLPEIV